MNYRQVVEVPEHITSSFFELPCIFIVFKETDDNNAIYGLHNVKNRVNGCHRQSLTGIRGGALAEDYSGQWWYLTKEELEDYIEECGLARESLMP